jgi:DNA replication protein DnaC
MHDWIKKLSKFEALIIDDLGYVQHSREEMEVLFTLLSDRTEDQKLSVGRRIASTNWIPNDVGCLN